jgi:hypothetical protein
MARVSVKSVSGSPPLAEQPSVRPWLLVWVFQLPGNLVADVLKATDEDDRMAIRVLIDMLFWNLVVVLAAVIIYSQFG